MLYGNENDRFDESFEAQNMIKLTTIGINGPIIKI